MHGTSSENSNDDKRDAEEIEETLTEVFEDDSQPLKPGGSSGGDSVFIGMHASGSATIHPK
jgi:hypothetical protein